MPRTIPSRFLSLCLACFASCSSAPFVITPANKADFLERIGSRLRTNAYAAGADFTRFDEFVERHRSDIDAASTEAQLGRAVNAVLGEFGLSHLWVWTPEQIRVREAGLRGGLGLKTVTVERGRLITSVIRGGPADLAGIAPGDLIVAIEGQPATSRGFGAADKGETRRVTRERAGQRREIVLTYTDHPRANPPAMRWLEERIAVICVPSFSRSFYEDRSLYEREVIEGLFAQARDAAGIILDLRSNGGGYYLHVEHLAAMVLPRETNTIFVIHREENDAFLARGGNPNASLLERARSAGQVIRPVPVEREPYAGPLAVLVDGRSGSGGESLPAMLRAAGRAVILGTRTAGSVLSGDNFALPGGFVLFYPQAESVMPDGTRLEGNGVVPDVVLTPEQTADDGTILELARRRLAKRE